MTELLLNFGTPKPEAVNHDGKAAIEIAAEVNKKLLVTVRYNNNTTAKAIFMGDSMAISMIFSNACKSGQKGVI